MSSKMNVGNGGEPHPTACTAKDSLTTDQGVRIADNQNSLTAGVRGPVALEDFILREKITRFDHERIPERVVHARGYGAHGHFESYGDHSELTKASFLSAKGKKTEVFCRFSTVAGNKGSPDVARDARGFAVKFYTDEGNYDLVGNNIPVFFIQDAMKFPDLVHSVKPERDRGFPQAQSAHDTFWDFTSLTPETLHMLMWTMSDRGIPRSFRMMDGFGVHTFRMVNAQGEAKFVKFHWRAKLGAQSVVWNEALKINGFDPDFHRRDLWNAIESGDFPEWELSVQVFTEEQADSFDFDILDAAKLVPEELVPLTPLGKMVLNRNVDEFFAETEQVAFCPSHVVPGIDFTNDPLLQGRLFSYLDTQISRLGSPNFHQIPVNAAKCPVHNFSRGGHMQTNVPKMGRVSYEPNSLSGNDKAEHPSGFTSHPAAVSGEKRRLRPESFADHYTQARLFWKSQTPPEQRHLVSAFGFELGKVEMRSIRTRMLGHLANVDEELCRRVEEELGMPGSADAIEPAVPVRDVEPSPALSILANLPAELKGRKVGILIAEGSDKSLIDSLKQAIEDEGATVAFVAPTIGEVDVSGDGTIEPAEALAGGPSVVFDTVAVVLTEQAAKTLSTNRDARDWLSDAWRHCKIIGWNDAAKALLQAASVPSDAKGIIELSDSNVSDFIDAAKQHRIWEREES